MKRFIFLSCLIMGLTNVSKIQSATMFDDWRKGVGFAVLSSVAATSVGCSVADGLKSENLYEGAGWGLVLSIPSIALYFLVRNKSIPSNAKRTLTTIVSPIVFSLLIGIVADKNEKIKNALIAGVPSAVVSGGMMYAGTRFGVL